jgi:excisionase family DNA binding protein
MDRDYLSTGEVARLCGVTRDAVVKWIKSGKLPATQTPGGHYRVARGVGETLSQEVPCLEGESPASESQPGGQDGSLRCWEYFGEEGIPKDVCKSCLVYLARAQRCYRLAELGEESGHRLHFCRNECRTCAYYRACQGLATEVLIVTDDEALTHRLLMRASPEKVSIRFARSGYESSAIVSSFSPALIVLDSSLTEVRNGQLPRSMVEDDRIPGSRVMVALRDGSENTLPDGVQALTLPFSASKIEKLAEEAADGLARAPRDVA